VNNRFYFLGCLIQILVFPEPDGKPAGGLESLVRVKVPGLVPGHFLGPVVSVSHGDCVMLGATVPEAAVQEDGDLDLAENQISGTAQFREGTGGDTVA
jgi:hypothetical protein